MEDISVPSCTYDIKSNNMDEKIANRLLYKKLAHFCWAYRDATYFRGTELLNELKQKALINHTVTSDNAPVSLHSSRWIGYSLLHFAVHWNNKIGVEELIKFNADITIKNRNGSTPLHLAMELDHVLEDDGYFQGNCGSRKEIVDYLLKAHIDYNVKANQRNNQGLSHFHIACMTNNARAVKFFLNCGVDVDETVHPDSSYFPGCTSLHLAVKYKCTETINLLLDHGANIHARNNRGKNPLQDFARYHMGLMEESDTNDKSTSNEDIEIIFHILFKAYFENASSTSDGVGLSHLHVACTSPTKTKVVELLKDNLYSINARVDSNSAIWPGFTPLHFAAHFNHEIVEVLVKEGASLSRKDSRGITPLDICIKNYGMQILKPILLSFDFKYSKLLDEFLRSFRKLSCLKSPKKEKRYQEMVKASMPLDSPIWPGYTALHLAVLFLRRDSSDSLGHLLKLDYILNQGADFTIQDAYGRTPLHLAFQIGDLEAVKSILWRHESDLRNPTSQDGLSHFHIACLMEHDDLVGALVKRGVANVNEPLSTRLRTDVDAQHPRYRSRNYSRTLDFAAGATPIHISAIQGNRFTAKLLLDNGADTLAKDNDGLTAAHLAVIFRKSQLIPDLLRAAGSAASNAVSSQGLTHFHAACYSKDPDVVKRYLQFETDVDARVSIVHSCSEGCACEVKCNFWTRCAGYTGLHFAVESQCLEVIQLLVERGADVCRRDAKGLSPLLKVLSKSYLRRDKDRRRKIIQVVVSATDSTGNIVDDSIGLTKLHLACMRGPVAEIERSLKRGCDVNAAIRPDSPVWPGYTALHFLVENMTFTKFSVRFLIKFIRTHGADVRVKNADGDTPIHIYEPLKGEQQDNQRKIKSRRSLLLYLLKLLLDTGITGSVVVANEDGLSDFHIACRLGDADLARRYLARGVDVDHRCDFFSANAWGRSALHYAVMSRSDELVELLLEHGCDADSEDSHGNTALHYACSDENISAKILELLLSKGRANVHATNILGQSPLELIATRKKYSEIQKITREEKLKILFGHGATVNLTVKSSEMLDLQEYIFHLSELVSVGRDVELLVERTIGIAEAVDAKGRNILHHITDCAVSIWTTDQFNICFKHILTCLLRKGCNIDHQNNKGNTPVQIAAKTNRSYQFSLLLEHGADIDIENNKGLTPSKYVITTFNPTASLFRVTGCHLNKMKIAGCRLSTHSDTDHQYFSTHLNFDISLAETKELDELNNIYINSKTTLKKVFAKTEHEMSMLVSNEKLVEIMESDLSKFPIFGCLLKMQYRRGQRRRLLQGPAAVALNLLSDCNLPDFCCEMILKYLSNIELCIFISSVNRY